MFFKFCWYFPNFNKFISFVVFSSKPKKNSFSAKFQQHPKYHSMSHLILAESILSEPQKNVIVADKNVINYYNQKFLSPEKFTKHVDSKETIIIRSKSDTFDYKLIRLENGIRILMVSDPTYKQLVEHEDSCDEALTTSSDGEGDEFNEESNSHQSTNLPCEEKPSAIVVGVKVGSFSDPKNVQGMAHCLEHLLTMGSEKFPNENEIDEYLALRGGYQNAFTDFEHTIYEIEVNRLHLKKALDLICHAVASPLLRQESFEKEIKPIDTEFVQAMTDDDTRIEVLFAHLANEEHPAHGFFYGNRKSLIDDLKANNIDLRQELIKFHQKYYRPENIVVVVQSQESMENLQQWCSSVFSLIESKTDQSEDLETWKNCKNLPFSGNEPRFHRLFYVESIDAGTRLVVSWFLAPVLDDYLKGVPHYYGSLLGHEGKGSLISQLRNENLALSIETENQNKESNVNNHLFCWFTINILLTEKGSVNLDRVVQLLFEYLSVIQKCGPQQYYFDETQTIQLYDFNYQEEKDSLSYSVSLAENLLYFPVEHLLTKVSLTNYHYDKEVLEDFGRQLRFENANFIVLNQNLTGDLETNVEPWMNIKYQSMEIPHNWIKNVAHLNGESRYFHYPKPNRFIIKDFTLQSDVFPIDSPERDLKYPRKIIQEPRMILWHKTDFKFKLPKASINIHLLSPSYRTCAEDAAMSAVLLKYLTVILQEDTYDAYETYFTWCFSHSMYGLWLSASGFNEKLFKLVFIILEKFLNVEFSVDCLESIKKDLVDEYHTKIQDSSKFFKEIVIQALLEKYFTRLELISLIPDVTIEKLINYRNKFLSNLSFEVLIQGNVNPKESKEFSQRLKSMFGIDSQTGKPLDRKKYSLAMIPCGIKRLRTLTFVDENRVSLISLYQQLGPYNLKDSCYLRLFICIINEQCFQVLRTQEGLGYSVYCKSISIVDILGFIVVVLSDKFNCTFVENRIREFLVKHCKEYIMEVLLEENFEEILHSEITHRMAPDLNLNEECSRNMDLILNYNYSFDILMQEANQLRQINFDDFKSWANDYIFKQCEQRIFIVQITGNNEEALNECLTFDHNSICKQQRFKDDDFNKIELIQSKEQALNESFVSNLDQFKKGLEFYPAQATQIMDST